MAIKRIRATKLFTVDVDETMIVIDGIPPGTKRKDLVRFKNKRGAWAWGMPHKPHLKIIRDFAARGFTVMVWSAGGEDWAYYIVGLLKMKKYVDYTSGKPDWVLDDKTPNQFMQNVHFYLDPVTGIPKKFKRTK